MPSRIARLPPGRKELRAGTWHRLHCLAPGARDADAWHELGAALMRLGDRAAACVAWHNALRLCNGLEPAQLALGNLLFDCGEVERALVCFEGMSGATPRSCA